MIEEDSKGTDDKRDGKGVNVNQIVYFQNTLEIFKDMITKSSHLYYEFWRELLEEIPDLSKLKNLGS